MFPFLYYIICCSCILKDRCSKPLTPFEGFLVTHFTVRFCFKTSCVVTLPLPTEWLFFVSLFCPFRVRNFWSETGCKDNTNLFITKHFQKKIYLFFFPFFQNLTIVVAYIRSGFFFLVWCAFLSKRVQK